jgi:predicted phosphodiesterase
VIRVAAITEIHGNVVALEAVLQDVRRLGAELLFVGGDLALDGPDSPAALDLTRELEEDGALVVSGISDMAVADFDFGPLCGLDDAAREAVRPAAEWAHEALGPERVDWLRRLPSERRVWAGDTLILWSHGMPRSGAGIEAACGVARHGADVAELTDARVVCSSLGHVSDVRRTGDRLVVNPGSVGYPLEGTPVATWALLHIGQTSVRAEIHRVPFDHSQVADAVSARGLPGDDRRAHRFRTGLRT